MLRPAGQLSWILEAELWFLCLRTWWRQHAGTSGNNNKFRVCDKSENSSCLLVFLLHLESIYLPRFIALCHIHTKHSTWNVRYFQTCILWEMDSKSFFFPHLLIDIQHVGRVWYTNRRQMKWEICVCVFSVNAHIYIFPRRKERSLQEVWSTVCRCIRLCIRALFLETPTLCSPSRSWKFPGNLSKWLSCSLFWADQWSVRKTTATGWSHAFLFTTFDWL